MDDMVLRQAQFLEAMSRVPAAVHLVTTDGPRGRFGMTVASMCSLSADPPSVLVCVQADTPGLDQLLGNRCFAVNLLRGDAAELSEVFAGRRDIADAERFTMGDWRRGATGSPLLTSAAASVECELETTVKHATHQVLFGRAVTCEVPAQPLSPLLYWQRAYTTPDGAA